MVHGTSILCPPVQQNVHQHTNVHVFTVVPVVVLESTLPVAVPVLAAVQANTPSTQRSHVKVVNLENFKRQHQLPSTLVNFVQLAKNLPQQVPRVPIVTMVNSKLQTTLKLLFAKHAQQVGMQQQRKRRANPVKRVNFKNWEQPPSTVVNFVQQEQSLFLKVPRATIVRKVHSKIKAMRTWPLVNIAQPDTNTSARPKVALNAPSTPSNPRLRLLLQHVRVVMQAKAVEIWTDNPHVNKTNVHAQRPMSLRQQVLIALDTMPTFVPVVIREKSWYHLCVHNVPWAKQRLDLLLRVSRVPRDNTKVKMEQEPSTIVNCAALVDTVIKINNHRLLRAKIVLPVVGPMPLATVLLLLEPRVLLVPKGPTILCPNKAQTRASIADQGRTTMSKDKMPPPIAKVALLVHTAHRTVQQRQALV